jgi:hypothetical protein
LNPRPAVYETAALPLSYFSFSLPIVRKNPNLIKQFPSPQLAAARECPVATNAEESLFPQDLLLPNTLASQYADTLDIPCYDTYI